jgi:hypothetical protein
MHTMATTGETTTSTTNMAPQNKSRRLHRLSITHHKRTHRVRRLISLAGASQIRSAKDSRRLGEGTLPQELEDYQTTPY